MPGSTNTDHDAASASPEAANKAKPAAATRVRFMRSSMLNGVHPFNVVSLVTVVSDSRKAQQHCAHMRQCCVPGGAPSSGAHGRHPPLARAAGAAASVVDDLRRLRRHDLLPARQRVVARPEAALVTEVEL